MDTAALTRLFDKTSESPALQRRTPRRGAECGAMRPHLALGLLATMLLALALTGCGTSGSGTSSSNKSTVPRLVGLSASQAQHRVDATSLSLDFARAPINENSCRVVSQRPRPGAHLDPSSSMSARCVVRVPNLIGRSADRAQSKLEDVGLTTAFAHKPNDGDYSRCHVVKQKTRGSIAPNSSVRADLTCTPAAPQPAAPAPAPAPTPAPAPAPAPTPAPTPSAPGNSSTIPDSSPQSAPSLGTCADGSTTQNAGHQGACSGHGGLR